MGKLARSSRPFDQYQTYEVVKQSVLKAYELVPEVCRQKLRSANNLTDQTHVELVRVQEQMFDRWLTSNDVKQDFNQLRQVILIEHFKKRVHDDTKTRLHERDIKKLHKAATIADTLGIGCCNGRKIQSICLGILFKT